MRRFIHHLLHRRELWLVRHLDLWLPIPNRVGNVMWTQTVEHAFH